MMLHVSIECDGCHIEMNLGECAHSSEIAEKMKQHNTNFLESIKGHYCAECRAENTAIDAIEKASKL